MSLDGSMHGFSPDAGQVHGDNPIGLRIISPRRLKNGIVWLRYIVER